MLVGVNSNDSNFNTVKKTGGANTHTLTALEMPNHTHIISTKTLTGTFPGGMGAEPTGVFTNERNDDTQNGNVYPQINVGMNASHNHTASSSGSGNAHNNLQPYITVYMWEWTA